MNIELSAEQLQTLEDFKLRTVKLVFENKCKTIQRDIAKFYNVADVKFSETFYKDVIVYIKELTESIEYSVKERFEELTAEFKKMKMKMTDQDIDHDPICNELSKFHDAFNSYKRSLNLMYMHFNPLDEKLS